MCGIFCAVDKKGSALDQHRVHRSMAELHYRGPDHHVGAFIEPHVFVGQTVLSLTGDIDRAGDKDYLWSEDKSVYLTFNGEVYNYLDLYKKYLSDHLPYKERLSDADILANLFSETDIQKSLTELDGMYALCFAHVKDKTLHFTRDPQGEKSLYLYEDENYLVVSSAISAIQRFVGSKLELNLESLKDYFSTRHFLQYQQTCFKKIRTLRPGEHLTYSYANQTWGPTQKIEILDLISEEEYRRKEKLGLEAVTDEFDSLLRETINLMIPKNRSYASVFSGGIDSSLISSYLHQDQDPAFFIAVNHKGKDLISNDLKAFEKVLGKEIFQVHVDKVQYAQAIPKAQRALGSPLKSHSFIGQFLLSEATRYQGARVLYGGEGADELFGGYNYYLRALDSFKWNVVPSPYTEYGEPLVSFDQNSQGHLKEDIQNIYNRALEKYSFIKERFEQRMQAALFTDFYLQVSQVGLRGADLMSLDHSVETRSVFIRRPIVEYALNLPLKYKFDASKPASDPLATKIMLKELFIKKFSREHIFPKQGFSGFPNESVVALGPVESFMAFDTLGISRNKAGDIQQNRDAFWKLINTEFFLRQFA